MKSTKLVPRLLSGALSLAALACMSERASAVNLVQNGSFETGNFGSWTEIGDTTFNGVQCPGSGVVPEGRCDAFFGSVGTPGGIQQFVTTVAGGQYLISFVLQGDGSLGNLAANFGAANLATFATPQFGATTFSFLTTANSTNSVLSFQFSDDEGFVQMDAVQVMAVPEPSTFATLALGLAGIGAWRRRKARQRQVHPV